MKRKKNVKQKIVEIAYEKQALQKKIIHLQRCMKEVNDMINSGKK